MRTLVPPWLREPDKLNESSSYSQMTPEERLEHFVQACNLAIAILQHRDDWPSVLAHRDSMPPWAEETWNRLITEARRARTLR